jgi:hypothetical protein
MRYQLLLAVLLLALPCCKPSFTRSPDRLDFDPQDSSASAQWAKEAIQDYYEAVGNEMAMQRKQQLLAEQLQSLVGKRINWKMNVDYVSKTGISLTPVVPRREKDGTPIEPIRLQLFPGPCRWQGVGFEIPREFCVDSEFPLPVSEWATTLRPRDRVTLAGKIDQCKPFMGLGSNSYTIALFLADYQVSP